MAIHSSILAWEIAWTEEPGRLESMGSQESEIVNKQQKQRTLFTQ
jgi:PIN domain nuclease of toxin-antitoxin system